MPFEVMHRDRRLAQRHASASAKAHPTSRAPARPGTARVGDGVDVGQRFSAIFERRPQQGHDTPDMVARRQFRDDAAVLGVHRHLRVQGVRQQPGCAVVERDTGFVAGGFNTED
jgi:hypothetical protein